MFVVKPDYRKGKDGELIGILGISRDITKRKEAEEYADKIKIEKEKLFFLIAKRGSSFHMVLLYADSLENSPLVFDNETNNIVKLEKREDLKPIVAFNEYQSLAVSNGKIKKEEITISWGKKNHFKEILIKIKGEQKE